MVRNLHHGARSEYGANGEISGMALNGRVYEPRSVRQSLTCICTRAAAGVNLVRIGTTHGPSMDGHRCTGSPTQLASTEARRKSGTRNGYTGDFDGTFQGAAPPAQYR